MLYMPISMVRTFFPPLERPRPLDSAGAASGLVMVVLLLGLTLKDDGTGDAEGG